MERWHGKFKKTFSGMYQIKKVTPFSKKGLYNTKRKLTWTDLQWSFYALVAFQKRLKTGWLVTDVASGTIIDVNFHIT